MSCSTPGGLDQFGGRLVRREVPTGLDDLAPLRVDVFNRVHNRHDIGFVRKVRPISDSHF